MIFRAALLLIVSASLGCTPVTGPGEGALPKGRCTPGAYAGLAGAPLAATSFPADLVTRIVEPGMAVTMDYNPDRLTVLVDEAGIIQSASCG